ncbi:MAG TPA: 50S ribosomal protein L13 [Nitrososphaerales archaeon]|nr:50S ribosomal protein L13 [Nitrososphaerales archaeon]
MVEIAKTEQPVVVDAAQQVAGRMASKIAKLLIEGKHVVVLNAETSLMSGSKKNIFAEYMQRKELKSIVNPINAPHRPRQPNMILNRMIRGMLPRRKPKGQNAFKRLKVHIGIPTPYRTVEKMTFEDAKPKKQLQLYVTIGEIAVNQGWRKR